MKYDRLFQILYLLQTEGRLTSSELARRLEVSERTVRRDVETLVASGAPVRTERGHAGGVSLMPGAHLTSVVLTPEEREQVVLGVKAMTQLRAGDAARTALEKVSGAFGAELSATTDVDLCPWHDGDEPVPWLAELRSAVRDRRCVRLSYVGRDGAAGDIVVEPVRVVNENRSWHLVAWCRTCGHLRSLRLNRIQEASVLPEGFEWGQRHEGPASSPLLEEMPQGREERLRLRVLPGGAPRALDFFRPDEYVRLDDGSLLVDTRLLHYEWVLGLLVELGASARVLEPAGLRAFLLERAREICATCENPDGSGAVAR